MKRKVWCDPGAVLLLGLLLFSLTLKEIAALFTAVFVHEAGHLIALMLIGAPPDGIHFTISGPVILYHQPEEQWKVVFCALSGPFLGLLLFCAFFRAWPECAGISLLLSIMNLLPVLPLDGGRAMNALLRGRIRFIIPVFGFLIPFAFMLAGLILIYQKQNGSGLLLFGAWLLILTCQEQQFDVK